MRSIKKLIKSWPTQAGEALSAVREANRHVRAISPKLWWWKLVSAAAGVIGTAVAVLGLSFGYQSIITRAVANGQLRPTWPVAVMAIGAMVVFAMTRMFVSVVGRIWDNMSKRAERLYLTRMRIAKARELDLGAMMSPDFGRLAKWRDRYGEDCLMRVWKEQFDIVSNLLRAGIGGTIVGVVDPKIMLFAVGPAVVDLLKDWRSRRRRLLLRREGYEDSRQSSLFSALFSTARSIASLRLRGRDCPWAADRFERSTASANSREALVDRSRAIDEIVARCAQCVFFVALALYAARLTVSGGIEIAAAISLIYGFNAVLNSLSGLIGAPASLGWELQDFRFFLAFERAEPLVAEPAEPKEPAKGPVGVRASSLSFRYPVCLPSLPPHLREEMGAKETRQRPLVLSSLDIEVAPGELVALVGANGSGKSTFLSLLVRQYLPEAGAVSLSSVPTSQIHRSWFPRRVAFLPQLFQLHDLSLEEAVSLDDPQAIDRDRLRLAAEMSLANEVVADLQEGWSTLYGAEEGGVELSGGQKQRLALCGALYHALSPPVGLVLLDEPTSQMDAAARNHFFRSLAARARAEQKTLVVATHDFGWLHLFDRIAVLKHGKVTDTFPAEELQRISAAALTDRLMA